MPVADGLRVVLVGEDLARAVEDLPRRGLEAERALLAAELPHDRPGLPVHLVDRPGVSGTLLSQNGKDHPMIYKFRDGSVGPLLDFRSGLSICIPVLGILALRSLVKRPKAGVGHATASSSAVMHEWSPAISETSFAIVA